MSFTFRARLIAVFSTLLFLAGCAQVDTPPPIHTPIAIENATLVEPPGDLRAAESVLVVNDRIAHVGSKPAAYPEGTIVLDGRGKYLIPGLWDMHVHLTFDDTWTRAMPEMFLRYGITSVRDTGGLLHLVRPVVQRMRAAPHKAPRVFFSGPLLDGAKPVYDGDARPGLGVAVPDVEAARERVARLAEAGVDFLKIYELVQPDVFRALVEEARRHRLPITAHVPLTMLASEAGPQVQGMEHLRNIELDCAHDHEQLLAHRQNYLQDNRQPGNRQRTTLHTDQRLAAVANSDPQRCTQVIEQLKNTIQIPTLRLNTLPLAQPFDRADIETAVAEIPAAARRAWRRAETSWRQRSAPPNAEFAHWSLDLTGRMHRAGVPIGAGTDTPIGYAIPGYSLHTELERLTEAGLSAGEALAAATTVPPTFFGLQNEMGSIAPGMRADLVLLRQNPLLDIRHTRSIEHVIGQGYLITPQP